MRQSKILYCVQPLSIGLYSKRFFRFLLTSDPKQCHPLGRMSSQSNPGVRVALLQGTLDLLILKTLLFGPHHGQGVARSIQRQSEEVFFVDHGSLYLALQRLEDKKWIGAKWGVSENNRKARFYSLTTKGRQQLVEKGSEWQRLTRAIGLILDGGPSSEEV
jgi:PadR family transcriptional regulator PadR